MAKKTEKIKNALSSCLGTECNILYKQGRKRILIENCRILAAYPCIFVISYSDKKTKKTIQMSFSYTDILTKTVSISKICI